MGDALKILYIEDRTQDVALAKRELEHEGLTFTWRTIVSAAELPGALSDFVPDIVLCSCSIPGNDSRVALDLVRLQMPAPPFVFLCEAPDEEAAIAGLACGAADYLLKTDLRRLGLAVRRAIIDRYARTRTLEIEQSRQRLTEVLEASADMVVMSEPDGLITFVNEAACRLLGESRAELMCTEPRPSPRMPREAMLSAIENGSWQGEVAVAAREGVTIATSQVITAHKDADGKVRHFSTIAHDLRSRNAFEARIHKLVHYDTLTGLPNLSQMDGLVRRSIRQARRNDRVIALVIVNLDRFRLVDEGYGRDFSDHVLKNVTAALMGAISRRDAVARVGQDEFLVVLSDLADPLRVAVLVQQLLDAIAMPCHLSGRDLQITASAGIAVYPNDGRDFETLLRNASAAMHETKVRAHGGWTFHSGDVGQRAQQRLQLEIGLRSAIQHHELSLHYQPQFELRNGQVCGVEALARWFRPDGEVVEPSIFIPLAEQTGLIAALGAWVLQQACTTVAAWRDASGRPPMLCVNVSTLQIGKELAPVIARVIELTGFPIERLELEITESVLIDNADVALECLAECKRLGVRIAMDDFGTGFSSLSYLSRLPVDRLKIDKSLIHGMSSKPKDAAIIRVLISLGQELGFTVIAEGVETEEQLEMLREFGCEQVQGYLLARPACAADVRALLMKKPDARRLIVPSRAATFATANMHVS